MFKNSCFNLSRYKVLSFKTQKFSLRFNSVLVSSAVVCFLIFSILFLSSFIIIPKNYVDEKYDQAAIKYLKAKILNDVKQQFSSSDQGDKINIASVKSSREKIL